MAKNELVKAENFKLLALDGNAAEAVAEEMEGLGPITFDRVKIPAGGGIAFELPGEDEDSPESSPSIVGVILDHHAVNVYWRDSFSGSTEPPDCSSLDGKKGTDRDTGEIKDCTSCAYNQFGSDGRGKACKNTHWLYIAREGNPIPLVLTLPPSSLKAWTEYLGKKILLRGLRPHQVITRITLKKENNPDGIAYSRAVFAYQDTLSAGQVKAAEGMRAMVRTIRQRMDASDINAEEYAPTAAAPGPDDDGFMDVADSDTPELPFT